ncbi:hypothetical protein WISP_72342 [Willisornis vidua]|uniref:Uncharacterized protein n=1 Tax=Willisornis vidua TaxID=1566151 RepID=A0ABQ9D739_9PASS|nr:hypothetical protein WISP_72342 [Willisornis vidua]
MSSSVNGTLLLAHERVQCSTMGYCAAEEVVLRCIQLDAELIEGSKTDAESGLCHDHEFSPLSTEEVVEVINNPYKALS